MISTAAFAQEAAPSAVSAAQASPAMQFLPFILIAFIFYFMLIRPQQKRMRLHQDMVGGLKRGDRVVTAGGIIGTVAKVESDDVLLVEISEGVTVQVARSTVASVVPTEADSKKGKRASTGAKQVANDN